MLQFVDPTRAATSRRDFLRIGSLGLGSLSLPALLAAQSQAASRPLTTGKSVIFLFQHGGPSQFETFDPKMNAPLGNRSVTRATSTSVPGTAFGGTMTQLAKLAHRFAVVRSFQSGSSAHKIQPIVSSASLDANIGSLYSRVVGPTDPVTGMPTNTAIFPNAVDPEQPGPFNRFGTFASPGELGASFTPFVPGAGGELQKNMTLSMDRGRLDDRRGLLSELDRIKRQVDATGMLRGLDKFQEQAFEVILGGVAQAFDLSREDPKTIARYDTSHLTRTKEWTYKNNRTRYTANSQSLGKLLLLARRLCEAGCGFVTVTTDFVWDMHADVNNLGMDQGMEYVGSPFDHAVSAFMEDCDARGLNDKIMLVATGEMGRTPKVNSRGGRDHWGGLTPLLVYGGGNQGGEVIGQSARDGGQPASTPITSANLIATIMHTLLDIGELRVTRGLPVEVARVITESEPIRELLG